MNLLIFGASLRTGSLNKKLALYVAKKCQAEKRGEVQYVDFRAFEMPVYDGDIEAGPGIPDGAKRLAEAIQRAGALIVCTPEYNGGIPGPLKNAVDWVSRVRPMPLAGKPLLLMSASPGALGGVRGLWHTRVPFEALGTLVYSEMFGLPRAEDAFDAEGQLKEEGARKRLTAALEHFLEFATRLMGTPQRAT